MGSLEGLIFLGSHFGGFVLGIWNLLLFYKKREESQHLKSITLQDLGDISILQTGNLRPFWRVKNIKLVTGQNWE